MANKKACLLGMSAFSNDMRDLRSAISADNTNARMAADKFNWAIAKWTGSFFAEPGGLHMLVFTGGTGENDSAIRAEICSGLCALSILLNPGRNNVRGEAVISAEDVIIVNHVGDFMASREKPARAEPALQPV
jgi:acetate kinase